MRVEDSRAPVAMAKKPAHRGQSDAVDEALRGPSVAAIVYVETGQLGLLTYLTPEAINLTGGQGRRKDPNSICIAGQPIDQLHCVRAEPDRAGTGLGIGQSGR